MRSYATQWVRPVSTGGIRRSRAVEWRIARRRGLLERFRRFVVSTEWEELLSALWIETACAAVLVASCCFFAPLMAAIVIRMNS